MLCWEEGWEFYGDDRRNCNWGIICKKQQFGGDEEEHYGQLHIPVNISLGLGFIQHILWKVYLNSKELEICKNVAASNEKLLILSNRQ